MRAFLITVFCLELLSFVLRVLFLGIGDYPRVVTNTRLEDSISILISIGFLVWVSYLLFVGS